MTSSKKVYVLIRNLIKNNVLMVSDIRSKIKSFSEVKYYISGLIKYLIFLLNVNNINIGSLFRVRRQQ